MVDALAIFEGKQIRRHWDDARELWYFSVIDVVSALTGQEDFQLARNYWKVMKNRLFAEGSETVTKCNRLKLLAADGKKRFTDCADTETMFRIIQSIPSKYAEPFKLWLARVGYERVEESVDPERTIRRALSTYKRQGRSDDWINMRLKSIEVRKDLTDEWENRGVKNGKEFAILTDDITFAWAGITTKTYKNYKGLRKENLRDNMTNLELVLNMLAEESTKVISKKVEPVTFKENRQVAKKGGGVAKAARIELEEKTGKPVISPSKYDPSQKKIE
jgi:hypothetical protein